jgi:1-acyl-sn-glycerol-3-phosphate acyltransferase
MSERDINRPPRHTRPFFHRLLKTIALIIIKLVARVDLRGMEHVPSSGALVVAINHLSSFDTLSMIAFAPVRQGTAFGAIEHRSDFIAGWALDQLGLIWVRRGEADREAIKLALDELRQGTALGVAIEGTRSRTGQLQAGKTGAAYLASRAGVPILPVAVWGTEKIINNLKHLRRSQVNIRVGAPLPPPPPRANTMQLEAYTESIMLAIARMMPEEYRGVYREKAAAITAEVGA